jgi:chemosensory pili system protein ChpA (sensor histidine kinase/response regulator)
LSDADFDKHFHAEPAKPDETTVVFDFASSSPPIAQPVTHPVCPSRQPVQLALPVVEAAADALDTAEATDSMLPADGSGDEQVKVIGALRIGIPLYNVYLNEADEWSRRLVTEVAEWSLERNQPVSDSTVALAHSLAGSSATVGFDALSEMARALLSRPCSNPGRTTATAPPSTARCLWMRRKTFAGCCTSLPPVSSRSRMRRS